MANGNVLAKHTFRIIVNFKDVYIAIVLLLFIKPAIAEDIEILDFVFNAGRIGLSIVYVGLIFFKIKKIRKDCLGLLAVFISIFFMTIIYKGICAKAITHYLPAIGFLMFILWNKENLISIFRNAISLGFLLLTLNLVTFLVFPDGLIYRESASVRVWLLGQKQDLAGFIFPMLYIAMVLGGISKKYKKTYVYMYIISATTVFLEQSITALICLVVLGILCFLDNFCLLRIRKPFLVSICIIAFGTIQYISYNFNSMPWFHTVLLRINTAGANKVRTLSTRFTMWKFAWNTFLEHPLLGMGELSRDNWINGVGFYHSILDNIYMDLIMTGGLIGIFLFLTLLIRSFSILNKYRIEKKIRYMSYCLFAFCIYMLFGSPFYPMSFFMITTAAWFPYLFVKFK